MLARAGIRTQSAKPVLSEETRRPTQTEVLDLLSEMRYVFVRRRYGPSTDTDDNVVLFAPQRRAATEIADGSADVEPSKENKLDATLLLYPKLAKGWDGYDAVPASKDSVRDALAFLKNRPKDILLPSPELSADGEVGLYWYSGDVFAEVGFYGDGSFSYYARYTPEGAESTEGGRDNCRVGDVWPRQLLVVLGKLKD